MPTRWLVDGEANTALWRELFEMPLRLVDSSGQWVADLGGGGGSFVGPLRRKEARMVTVDVDLAALRAARDIRRVAASVLHLPFRDGSLDAAAGRAILHHVPDHLDVALGETRRVVKSGGLVLFQEPTAGNALASFARHRFPTEVHDPRERPLSWEAYLDAIGRHFEVLEARPYFLSSYLLPHLVGRLPRHRRKFARALTRALFAWDRRLMAALPNLRRHAAYVAILAQRPRFAARRPGVWNKV